VRSEALHHAERGSSVAGFPDDLEIRLVLEQHSQSFAHQLMIVHE
jgi:hypothetical protein